MHEAGVEADFAALTSAGHTVSQIGHEVDALLVRAVQTLDHVRGDVGQRDVSASLEAVSRHLERAGRRAARSLDAFGQQVALAARTYAEADSELGRRITVEQ